MILLSDVIGAGILIAYYLVCCLLLPTVLRGWARVPPELVRKLQHIAYSLSVFFLLRFSAWYWAIAASALLVLLAYPVLMVIERLPRYKRFFVDRAARGGELRKQLIYVQLSFAVLIAVCWGILGIGWHYIVAVSVMAWGFGDAAAALVGKAFGRRRILHRCIEGAKTLEGMGAMMLLAFGAMFATLLFYAGKPWYVSLLIAGIVAPACGVVELFSRRGTDTVTVPFTAAALLLPLMYLLSELGW